MATERICAYEHCNNPLKAGAHGKRIYCSDKCRIAAHRAPQEEAKPIQQPVQAIPPQMTLAEIKAALISYPDKAAIKAIYREIFGETTSIPNSASAREYDRSIRIPTLTPDIAQPPADLPKYLPPRPILNPEADITRRMVKPEKGTNAWYLRYGDGDGE